MINPQQESMPINHILFEAQNPKALLLLAHGAGAGMNHSFMHALTEELHSHNISVVRFNFPYMEAGKKSPGSPKTNVAAWKEVLMLYQSKTTLPIFLSGKSYGGRMASHLLAEEPFDQVKGIIYFGFPLHAPGKNSIERADHLRTISRPQLFLQGRKDKLADPELITQVSESLLGSRLVFLEDADHSFNVPKRSGRTQEDSIQVLAIEASNFIDQQL